MIQRILLSVLLISFGLVVFSQPAPIGLGWAKNTVNGVVFRKNSVVTHKGEQFVAFYDSTGYVVLAKRKTGTENWQVKQTQYKGNTSDAHCSINLKTTFQTIQKIVSFFSFY